MSAFLSKSLPELLQTTSAAVCGSLVLNTDNLLGCLFTSRVHPLLGKQGNIKMVNRKTFCRNLNKGGGCTYWLEMFMAELSWAQVTNHGWGAAHWVLPVSSARVVECAQWIVKDISGNVKEKDLILPHVPPGQLTRDCLTSHEKQILWHGEGKKI